MPLVSRGRVTGDGSSDKQCNEPANLSPRLLFSQCLDFKVSWQSHIVLFDILWKHAAPSVFAIGSNLTVIHDLFTCYLVYANSRRSKADTTFFPDS